MGPKAVIKYIDKMISAETFDFSILAFSMQFVAVATGGFPLLMKLG